MVVVLLLLQELRMVLYLVIGALMLMRQVRIWLLITLTSKVVLLQTITMYTSDWRISCVQVLMWLSLLILQQIQHLNTKHLLLLLHWLSKIRYIHGLITRQCGRVQNICLVTVNRLLEITEHHSWWKLLSKMDLWIHGMVAANGISN